MTLHAINQKRHAMRRARERFGIEMTERMYRALVRNIQKGKKVKFIKQISDDASLWFVRLRGTPAIAIYNSEMNTVVTLLYTRRQLWNTVPTWTKA